MGKKRGCKARREDSSPGRLQSLGSASAGCFLCIKKSPKMDDYHLTLRTISCMILTSFRRDLPEGESSPWSRMKNISLGR